MTAYYNEIDPFCCKVLRKQIALGNLPDGVVDERDIRNVRPEDLDGFDQVHLFAGIGGMPYGLRLGGVSDATKIWTFGFPCQDISTAGRGEGIEGERSGLFFEVMRLLDGVVRRPDWLLAENVSALRLRGADRVIPEMEERGYTCRPTVVGAWATGETHERYRVWLLGHANSNDRSTSGAGEVEARTAGLSFDTSPPLSLCNTTGERCGPFRPEPEGQFGKICINGPSGSAVANPRQSRLAGRRECAIGSESQVSLPTGRNSSRFPSSPGEPQYEWEVPRLIELPMGGSVNGLPVRLVRAANRNALKAYGNAVVPQVVQLFGEWIALNEKTPERTDAQPGVRTVGLRRDVLRATGDLRVELHPRRMGRGEPREGAD